MKTMIDFDEMWNALSAYQPYAEKHGFGAEWLRMTTERTERAASDAADAADGVDASAYPDAEVYAVVLAEAAAASAFLAMSAGANETAYAAIAFLIRKAIEQEESK